MCGGEKELLYQSGIFADMFDAFVTSLRNTNIVVSAGFSWNDLGIALRLMNWLAISDDNKLVIMHECPDSILTSRGGLMPKFSTHLREGQISFIRAHFCDVDLDQLLSTLS
ncbi:MAG: hypothetical protein E2O85_02975 [Bacteroidetes bacterium]|nr:MAG: hypothetical protein E2O85_02975 [Bacteroidota bacterium]